MGGKSFERPRIEEVAQRELDTVLLADGGGDLRRRDRIAAEHEEVVPPRDGLQVERFAPDRRDCLLNVRCRRDRRRFAGRDAVSPSSLFKDRKAVELVRGPARAAGRPLQLAARRQRHALWIQQDDDRRIFIALPQDRFADRASEVFGDCARNHAATEFRSHADAFVPVDVDGKGGNASGTNRGDALLDRLLDIRRIKILSTYDQNVLEPPGHDHGPVTDKADIARTQPTPAIALDEGRLRGHGIVPVALRHARPREPDFTDGIGLGRRRTVGTHDAQVMSCGNLAA